MCHSSRKAVNGGWADFVPGYYRDMPGHIRANWDYDAVAISVSPMVLKKLNGSMKTYKTF